MSDEKLQKIIAEKIKNNELPCAVAFVVADQLSISPAEVGQYADQVKLRLVKCQLGLFGYQPEKRIVKPVDAVTPELEACRTGNRDRPGSRSTKVRFRPSLH